VSGEQKASFAIELKDGTSAAANSAAHALEQLRARLEADTRAVRGMQGALAKLKAGSLGNSQAAAVLKARIASQQRSIAGLQAHYVSLGGTFDAVKKATGEGGGALASVTGVLEKAGPSGQALAQVLKSVSSGMLGVVGVAIAAVGAIIGLTVAIAQATAALGRYVLAVADARRNETLHLEGMLRWAGIHGRATASTSQLQDAIDRVADSTGLGRDQIAGFASQIARAGVRGQNLNDILEVTAITASAAGDEAANVFRSQAVGAARAGASIKGLASVWRRRFGDIAQQQALGLDRQMARLHENVARLFDGVHIAGFLSVLNRVLSLFSQTTQTGRSLRSMVTSIGRVLSHDLVGDSRQGGDALRNVFRDMVIAFQRVEINLLQLRRRFLAFFPSISRVGSALNAAIITWEAWKAAIRGVGSSVLSVRRSFSEFGSSITKLYARFLQINWSNLGTAIVEGISNGLRRAWDSLLRTFTDLTGQLPESFRRLLGIHSPSRVFAQLGAQIPRGVEQGIARGSDRATAAAADLVVPPDGASSPNSPGGRGRRGRGRSGGPMLVIENLNINANSESEGRAAARGFFDEVANLLEGVGLQLAAPVGSR
jgi:hypothetical protein